MAAGSVSSTCLRSLICSYETSIGQFVYQPLALSQNMIHPPDRTTHADNGAAWARFTRHRPATRSNISGTTSRTNGIYTNLHIASTTPATASIIALRRDRLPTISRNSKQLNNMTIAWVNESAEMENEANRSIWGTHSNKPIGMRHFGNARTEQNIISA